MCRQASSNTELRRNSSNRTAGTATMAGSMNDPGRTTNSTGNRGKPPDIIKMGHRLRDRCLAASEVAADGSPGT